MGGAGAVGPFGRKLTEHWGTRVAFRFERRGVTGRKPAVFMLHLKMTTWEVMTMAALSMRQVLAEQLASYIRRRGGWAMNSLPLKDFRLICASKLDCLMTRCRAISKGLAFRFGC